MKKLWLVVAFACCLGSVANAGVISNFSITESSLSFDIDVTLPDQLPQNGEKDLYLYETAGNGSFTETAERIYTDPTSTFTGTQELRSNNPFAANKNNFGDYVFFSFKNDLEAGEEIVGTFDLTWSTAVFSQDFIDSMDGSSLALVWGNESSANGGFSGGQQLAMVPEPATATFIALFGGGILAVRRIFMM